MRSVSDILKTTYGDQSAIVVPGSGSFGMEAVARQFSTGQQWLVRRNGWFGYRWRQILEMGQIPAQAQVLKAQKIETGPTAPFSPALLQEVLPAIRDTQPPVVLRLMWRPRLGMMLPYVHLQSVSEAVHTVGGLVALDCIASGAMWIDMAACGVGVLISALQKGWSGSVMLNSAAHERIEQTTSTSFGCDLHK